MKTQNSKSLSIITGITFLTILLIASCKTQDKQETKDSVASMTPTSVKPPAVDIHTSVITGNIDALKQHIAAGSNLNEKDPFGGSSPLISAALFGKTEEAKLLLEAGADIDFQNNDGSTALLTAAFFGRPEIVKLLLEKGADKSIKNKYNATAFESVMAPWEAVKETYDMMGKMLAPMGLKLDYAYLQKVRPEIAAMLK
jgi:ankyrin repeat protein